MAKGMFVDVSICIGCKACQVACKEWNDLEGEPEDFADSGRRSPRRSTSPATPTTTPAG